LLCPIDTDLKHFRQFAELDACRTPRAGKSSTDQAIDFARPFSTCASLPTHLNTQTRAEGKPRIDKPQPASEIYAHSERFSHALYCGYNAAANIGIVTIRFYKCQGLIEQPVKRTGSRMRRYDEGLAAVMLHPCG
jgi:hypothetical protein